MQATASHLVERYGQQIADPVARLRFQRTCLLEAAGAISSCRPGSLRARIEILEVIARTHPLSRKDLTPSDRLLISLGRKADRVAALVPRGPLLRLVSGAVLVIGFVAVLGVGVSRESMSQQSPAGWLNPDESDGRQYAIWLVESSGETELYSNGLTIWNDFLTHTGPRSYPVFDAGDPRWESARWRSDPVGIVFHTTESDLAPFEPANNGDILQGGRQLVRFISQERLYNFVIDRFGRVYRTIPAGEYAFHAGHSIWSDSRDLFLGLNQSFIGVALETIRSKAGNEAPSDENVTPAQWQSARLLTEWLRDRYRISTDNCVAHEMVSVNPGNMLIGYHTDWAGKFPFRLAGLPDNYRLILPSIAQWGFRYDDSFVAEIGGQVWPGVASSGPVFERHALELNQTAAALRRARSKQYRELLERSRSLAPAKSWSEGS
jgi:hypothetical protein